jgi:hypothetical protein
MRRVLAVTVATTVVLVLWGMLFWALIAPRIGVFHQLPNDEDITALLVRADVQTGTYFMPWPRDTPETFERFVAQHRSGPFYRLSYVRQGVDPNSASKILKGTLQTFLTALFGVSIAFLAGSTNAVNRFAVVFLAGLIGSLYITVGDLVWFHLPWDNARGVLVFQIVSWALMAAMCARFLHSRSRMRG